MDLPFELKTAIDLLADGYKLSQLKVVSNKLTDKYKYESGNDASLITSDIDALTYSLVRMPATYGAVYSALKYTLEIYHDDLSSVIDVGSGTGAASWVVNELINPKTILCLEKEKAMRDIGVSLMSNNEQLKSKTTWKSFDLLKEELPSSSDLVISSYVLNELSFNNRRDAVIDMWEKTNKVLLIIEPGTKAGFKIIQEIKEIITKLGGYIIAPCPHQGKCPMNEDDWCHFTVRVARSKMHKLIKEGDVPYEDEKYTYVAFSKEEIPTKNNRVLRHPIITKGQVELTLCQHDGINKISLRKRNGESFKEAKKSKPGDSLLNL